MKVKFNRLIPDKDLFPALSEAFNRVIHSGSYIGGSEVEAFEREWADYCQAEYCVSCGSGQQALELLLRAHNIGYGDEVIVPSWTAPPTWKAILNVGASLKAVDVSLDTFLMEPEIAIKRAGKRTRAFMPVHLYGYRANANYGGWPIIEDACQAHGLKGLGTAAWSFYPTKNLGAYGDGGAITTNSQEVASLCRLKRDSSRLDSLQAAFLRVKLAKLDGEIEKRQDNAALYDDLLEPSFSNILIPRICVYHQYVIRAENRDALQAYLLGRGIETLIHYPIPPHEQFVGVQNGSFPVASQLAQEVLSLPISCSTKEVEYVCEMINGFYQ